MKKNLQFFRLLLVFCLSLFAFNTNAIVLPYLPPLQSFSGSAVTLATFSPTTSDYTLEVQGTVGTPITVAGSVYNYTPTTSGTVRFSQKKGIVYVYEGNVYMTKLTPSYYPTITDADVATNTSNLLRNASFETAGTLVSGTNYNFGAPWVTNVTVAASGGIRFANSTAGNVNGIWECVWRGTANTNYFAQPLTTTIKPNTTYKVIVNQLAGSNSYANFNFGLGSTANGMEYTSQVISLGNGKNGTWSTILTTPASGINATSYFTIKNTATNTATPATQTDALTQMDYIALVENNATATPGITGVSSATFLSGTAYAPENIAINFSAGDYYDMASYITNPSFEDSQTNQTATIPGWTNTYFVTQNNVPGQTWVKDGNMYTEKWIASGSNLAAGLMSQTISSIPNGRYRLTVLAHAIQQSNVALVTTGASVFAGASSTAINVGGTYTVDNLAVLSGSLNIGYQLVAPITCNWTGFDNFKLYYLGAITDPALTAPQTTVALTTTTNSATIELTGANLTSDVTITVPSSHITLSGTNVTGTSPNYTIALASANQLNAITVSWDKVANVSGNISFTSGTASKTVAVTTSDVETVAISGITLSAGTLNTPFALGTTTYTVKAPADAISTTVTAVTIPTIATVTNNGTTINASTPSVVLTGNSYNGASHTADYTFNWGGNYTFADWAANGSTDASLSIPTNYGWSATPTLTWQPANTSGNVRYMDLVAGANAGIVGITYTYSGSNYSGRIMFVRWDGSAARVYSYPVYLEACKSYNFAGKAAWNSVATAATLTFKINTAKDNTGTNYATGTTVTTTAGALIDASINSFTVPVTGVYYLTVTSSTASLCALADLALTTNLTPAFSVSKTYEYFDNSALTQSFTVQGNALVSDITLSAPAGISLNKTAITAAEAQCGVTVTATYDNSVSIADGSITVANTEFSKTIIIDAVKNNLIGSWDGNGSIDATASIPTASGWSSTGTVNWVAANLATVGSIRYIDAPANYTYNTLPYLNSSL